MALNIPHTSKKRIVVVGGGFAGLAVIRALRRTRCQVVLIDKHNYHMFKPLLYQVASSQLNVGDIAFPFRKIFNSWKDFYFRMAYIESVDPTCKILRTTAGEVEYDYLILATGCVPNFFGIDAVKREALAMSNITDALNIRNRVLRNFELAVTAATDAERVSRLNVVIVGGGASGVEIAGALAEMRRYVMPRDYPRLDMSHMHIYLVEGQDRILAAMSEKTSAEALDTLKRKGVEVLLNKKMTDYREGQAVFDDGERIPTCNLVWTSGIKCSTIEGIDQEKPERGNRIGVDAFNRVRGYDDIFAIGDLSIMHDDLSYENGHPQLARVAISQGKHLAKNLMSSFRGKELKPYRYRNMGVMATVGRNRAFVEWKNIQFGGFVEFRTYHVPARNTRQGQGFLGMGMELSRPRSADPADHRLIRALQTKRRPITKKPAARSIAHSFAPNGKRMLSVRYRKKNTLRNRATLRMSHTDGPSRHATARASAAYRSPESA